MHEARALPAKGRGLWRAAFAPVDPFEKERGNRYGYRPHSNSKVETGYGRWLTELDHQGLLDPASHPADRITRERVIAYVRELDCLDNSRNTVLGRLQELAEMAKTFAPDLPNRMTSGSAWWARIDCCLMGSGSWLTRSSTRHLDWRPWLAAMVSSSRSSRSFPCGVAIS